MKNAILSLVMLAFFITMLVIKEFYLRIELSPWAGNIFTAILNFGVYYSLLQFLFRTIRFFYLRRKKLPNYTINNFTNGLHNIRRVMLGLGFIFVPFGMIGIEIKELLTSLSIVAAAIAIVSKDFIVDILIGFYYSFSTEMELNDYVKIGEHRGTIREIGLMKLKLFNDDEDVVYVTNTHAFINDIINYSKGEYNHMSIDFEADIELLKSIESLEHELITALSEFKEYIDPESYALRIEELGSDSVQLKFKYRLIEIDPTILEEIRKKTNRKVFNYIAERKNQLQKTIYKGEAKKTKY